MNRIIQSIFYNNPDQYPPIINSTRLQVWAGYMVSLFCREDGQSWGVAYPPQARVTRLDTRGGGSWREYLRFVFRVLRTADRQASVYIGHDMHGLLPARLLAWRYRRPLIYHCHDYFDPGLRLGLGGRLVRAFEARFARTAQQVIVPDRERGDVVARDLHLCRPPVIVANAPLQAAVVEDTALPEALAAQGRTFEQIVLRQGKIGRGHAIEVTLRSMPHWHSRAWGLVVMGWGETDYFVELRQLAAELGVADRFVILPPVKYDDIFRFTSGAQVGHALYEPIHVNNQYIATASNKAMEYLAAGLPLLASARPAFQALVDRYRCGVTADESSPVDVARAINQLLDDPAHAQAMGAAGRRAFTADLCYERQYAPVLEALPAL